jgi:hypothetical protein
LRAPSRGARRSRSSATSSRGSFERSGTHASLIAIGAALVLAGGLALIERRADGDRDHGDDTQA